MNGIINLLGRLYVKASNGLPLQLTLAEQAFYGDMCQKQRAIVAGLTNGESLASLLESNGAIPQEYVRTIRTGETSGRVAEALKATIEGVPLTQRLRFEVWVFQLYVLVNLTVFLLVLRQSAISFSTIYTCLFGDNLDFVGHYNFLLALGAPFISNTLIIVAVMSPIMVWRFFPSLSFRLIPPLSRNKRRLESLEIKVRYAMLRGSGLPPDQSFQTLAKELGSRAMEENLLHATTRIRNGEDLGHALASLSSASGIDAFSGIAAAEATGRPVAMLNEQIEYTREYLRGNLKQELVSVLRWATVVFGVIIGTALCYMFSGLFYLPTLMDQIP